MCHMHLTDDVFTSSVNLMYCVALRSCLYICPLLDSLILTDFYTGSSPVLGLTGGHVYRVLSCILATPYLFISVVASFDVSAFRRELNNTDQ
jgi:hypothetical protein